VISRGSPQKGIFTPLVRGGVTTQDKRPHFLLSWFVILSYGPPWAHYLGGYQDRILGGPLGLPGLRCTAPDGVKHKDYRGEVLG
jgi:hypothetical protein